MSLPTSGYTPTRVLYSYVIEGDGPLPGGFTVTINADQSNAGVVEEFIGFLEPSLQALRVAYEAGSTVPNISVIILKSFSGDTGSQVL